MIIYVNEVLKIHDRQLNELEQVKMENDRLRISFDELLTRIERIENKTRHKRHKRNKTNKNPRGKM